MLRCKPKKILKDIEVNERCERMKRKSVLVSVMLIITILCTSCGTKLPEAGDYTEEDSASGSAVDSVQNKMETKKKESIYDRLPYCNDEHYYQFDDNGDLLQCKLGRLPEDASRRTYHVKNGKDVAVWRVNDKEIFYVAKKKELWRIPIGKDKDGACPQVDKAEKVLTDKNDIIDVYADDNYIAYISGEYMGVYHEYDRKTGKEITVDKTGKKNFTTFAGGKLLDVVGGEYVLLGSEYKKKDKTDSVSESIQTGIYIHKLGSGNVTKIDDYFVSDHEQVPHESARAAGEKFYYYGGYKWEKEKKYAEETKQDIWVYDARTGKREIFVSVKELIKCAMKNKAEDTSIGKFFRVRDIFIDKGKMYILAYDYGDYILYSRELTGNPELKYEEKASEFVRNIQIQNIREIERDIIEGKLLVGYYDEHDESHPKHIEKCYDFTSGVYKDVKESDYEGVYWCYGLKSWREYDYFSSFVV